MGSALRQGVEGGPAKGSRSWLCRDVILMVRYLQDSGQVPYSLVKFAISRSKDKGS